MSCPACHHPEMEPVSRFGSSGLYFRCKKCGNVLTANTYLKRHKLPPSLYSLPRNPSLPRLILNVVLLWGGILAATLLILITFAFIIKLLT